MTDRAAADPVISELREQISDLDRAILDAVNARLEVVAKIKAYKDSRGFEFSDPAREKTMLRELTRANQGPLSSAGVEELLRTVLELSKREVSRES